MNTTIDSYFGSPLEIDSEKAFLARLKVDLSRRGESGLILANFFPPRNPHQIDFLVVTVRYACHVELKTLTAPVTGGLNGRWSLVRPNGSHSTLDAKNPYRQALDGKHAISEELHAFERRDRSVPALAPGDRYYKHFDSVVCVFPELLPGSSVPSDYKVRVWGYPELLKQLTTGAKLPPGWSHETWVNFAMHLGLIRSEEDDEKLPPELCAAQEAVRGYRERSEEYQRRGLPPLVTTTLLREGKAVRHEDAGEALLGGRNIQLVGASGTGKTLLVRHLVLEALRRDRTPLVVSAIDYNGKLSTLLDRGIAHLHPDTSVHFLRSAERCASSMVLVVDGFNECPARCRDQFVRDLHAFHLRWRLPILITSQEPVELTGPLNGEVFQFVSLNDEERLRVFQAYRPGPAPADFQELCAPFETPYELSLAASLVCGGEQATTRATLFDAYVSHCCGQTEDATLVRGALCAVAALMQRQLVSSLPLTDARREALRFLNKAGGRSRLFNDALKCGLLEARQNRCAFRHEMLERFFQAEGLLQASETANDVAQTLALPRNRPVAEFVLGLDPDRDSVRRCLEELADHNVIRSCMEGKFGPVALEVAETACSELLNKAKLSLEDVAVELVDVWEGHKELQVSGGPDWSDFEFAAMQYIGESLHKGRFVSEVIQLARLTDEAWLWKLAHASGRPRPTLAQVDAAFTGIYTLVRVAERQVFPVSMIHQASRFRWFDCQSTRVGTEIERLVETLPRLFPGEMAFLCEMMRRPRADYVRHVPAILEACWQTRIYNLQALATEMVQPWGGTLEGADRARTIELLNSYLTDKHVWLNTSIFDVLDSFGEIESTATVEDIGRQIDAVLRDPEDGEARKWAYAIVTDIIDGFDTQAYYEAVHSLPKEAFAQLFTMAAFGAEHSFFSDWILGTLLKADHSVALPAFLRWSTPPKQGDSHPQSSVASYVRALAGCARFLKEPPATNADGSSDRQAWALYGQIIFWLLAPGVTDEELAARCEPLWCRLRSEYPFEAVDPLYQLEHASVVDSEQTASALGRVLEVFPDEVRGILEFGLKHLDKLSTLLSRFRETELTEFVIRSLGLIGDRGSARYIEPFCDSPKLGRLAVEALRRIRAAP